MLVLLVPALAAVFPELMREVADLVLAELVGVVVAAGLWVTAIRPRLEVTEAGVVVCNWFRTIRPAWDEIERFDCGQHLVVIQATGTVTSVVALPAPGIRRNLLGSPGPTDVLAGRLNERLASTRGSGGPVPAISLATAEGRRGIRSLAALAAAATIGYGLVRALVFRH
ncbi:MAG: PH domain-containing protein [Nocardioides sp.]